jgi:putative GTP pyrophosphokinase
MSRLKKTGDNGLSEIDQFVSQYLLKRPLYEELTTRLVELLKSLLNTCKVDVHLIESRTKDVESFREKIGRSSKQYTDPLKEVTDLAGIRIIMYYEKDIEKVCELIENEFGVDTVNSLDKKNILKPEEFGYQSIHFIAELSSSRCILPEWSHLAGLQVEIQVRTVLQHAWAAISHKLQYKQEGDVPQQLRRRLFRLSALLELADEEFMGLQEKTTTLTRSIEKQLSEGITDLEIDILTIEEFLLTSSEVEQLVDHAKQAGFGFSLLDSQGEEIAGDTYSDIVRICEKAGLTKISSLQSVMNDSINWSKPYLYNLMMASNGWEANAEFICILILLKKFRTKFIVKDLIQFGWSENVARRVLRIAKINN